MGAAEAAEVSSTRAPSIADVEVAVVLVRAPRIPIGEVGRVPSIRVAAKLPSYADFPAIARRSAWDADAIELAGDAAAWPSLDSDERARIAALLGGFLVGEHAVARDIRPFQARAPDDDVAACFAAQEADEVRHRRFFARVHAEVLGEHGEDAALAAARRRLPPPFVDLFERELRDAAARLAGEGGALVPAVSLYHGLLEGVVFLAGQDALLTRLAECGRLPGIAHGVARLQRDERWHVAFGARMLSDASRPVDTAQLAAQARRAVSCWGGLVSAEEAGTVLVGLDRRLRAIGLSAAAA